MNILRRAPIVNANKTHKHTTMFDDGEHHGRLSLDVTIPGGETPCSNPLIFNVDVSGCNSYQGITATLSGGGVSYTTNCTSPPPATLTLPPQSPPPQTASAGDYTLTVQVQCGNTVLSQTFDVTLAAPSRHKC
jgi:hypothetical protein